MAHVDTKARLMVAKIVYYGPAMCGKTTNLQMVHKLSGKKSDLMSLATEGDRTIFFDFLPIDLGKIAGFDIQFKLYTVPGQVKYNRTRKMVLKDVDGVVFVADSQRNHLEANLESLENLRENLIDLGKDPAKVPLVLQYNKRDLDGVLSGAELDAALNPQHDTAILATAADGSGVMDTLQTICTRVLRGLREEAGWAKAQAGEIARTVPVNPTPDPQKGAGFPAAPTQKGLGAPPAPAPTAKDPPVAELERAVAEGRKQLGAIETALREQEKQLQSLLRSRDETATALAEIARQSRTVTEDLKAVLARKGDTGAATGKLASPENLAAALSALKAEIGRITAPEAGMKAALAQQELQATTAALAARLDEMAVRLKERLDGLELQEKAIQQDKAHKKDELLVRLVDAIEKPRLTPGDLKAAIMELRNEMTRHVDEQRGSPPAEVAQRLAAMAAELDKLETRLGAVEKRGASGVAAGGAALESRLDELTGRVADHQKRLAALPSRPGDGTAATIQLAGRVSTLASALEKLEARVGALESRAGTSDGGMRERVAEAEGQLKALSERTEKALAAMTHRLEALVAACAPLPDLERAVHSLEMRLGEAQRAVSEQAPPAGQEPPAAPATTSAEPSPAPAETATASAAEAQPAPQAAPAAATESAQTAAQPSAPEPPPPASPEGAPLAQAAPEAAPAATPEPRPSQQAPQKRDRPPEWENDPEHNNAARIARVMVADIVLYHKDLVEEGVRAGTFQQILARQIEEARKTFDSRVPATVREKWDYLGAAIEALIDRKRRELGLGDQQ